MPDIIWTLPVPSTAFTGEAETLKIGGGRQVSLHMTWDYDDGEGQAALYFLGVEAYRCSFMTACTDEMLPAYDRVIDCGDTDWLAEIQRENVRQGVSPASLRHLMILFDDGPCYEFVCRSFRAE